MAVAKKARVIGVRMIGPDTRLIELVAAEPLGFIGGQYIIVDSGRVLPSGKAAKRAYSILSGDAEQLCFELVVKRIPGGLCSDFMHGLEVGAELRFSGPWGKLHPHDSGSGATLVFATDTGISAALGLIQGVRFAPLLATTTLVWLRVSADDFMPEELVRERVPASCGQVRIEPIVPIGHPERVAHARAVFGRTLSCLAQPPSLSRSIGRAYITGDGAVNYVLLDDLIAAGVPATRDNLESFFNMPRKSEKPEPSATSEQSATSA